MISLASSLPQFHVNDIIPPGVLTGMNAAGRVVVCIHFEPPYEYLWGNQETQRSVAEWHACAEQVRRLAAIAEWMLSHHSCRGNA